MASARDAAAVLLVQLRVERAAVHADADGDAAVLGLLGHQPDVLGPADVARVEAQALHARLQGRQRHLVLVVDVGDDRHRAAGHDLGQARGRFLFVACATNDVAAGAGEGVDLLERALDVGRLGDRHRLHGDRGVAADGAPSRPGSGGSCARSSRSQAGGVEVEVADGEDGEHPEHGVGDRQEFGGVGVVARDRGASGRPRTWRPRRDRRRRAAAGSG